MTHPLDFNIWPWLANPIHNNLYAHKWAQKISKALGRHYTQAFGSHIDDSTPTVERLHGTPAPDSYAVQYTWRLAPNDDIKGTDYGHVTLIVDSTPRVCLSLGTHSRKTADMPEALKDLLWVTAMRRDYVDQSLPITALLAAIEDYGWDIPGVEPDESN
ncbi:hypothetical protein CPHO_08485 [Corynebacterium phocae]|uniref:Uncharacterized protein n=1 Tax=Corynebacterium phocae TaxID=161895 RepID=A0A1L7D485_9CORY|nr:hypothetical protein [Corynebacterium phocae]APT92915.1 hypothetical protein CPHO_08485 [Corynebacterium phocae]KAA8723245.1 hypothetical protein F4V58_07985 [Corynebacterium phocae]